MPHTMAAYALNAVAHNRSDRARRAARAWLTSAKMGFDVTGDSLELLNAFTAHTKMQQAHRQSIFELRVSFAELDYVTGNIVSDARQ